MSMSETNTNVPTKTANNRHYYGGGKLGCYNHPDRPAVAQCEECHKGLCRECASLYTPILCDSCYNEIQREKEEIRQKTEKSRKRTDFIFIPLIMALCWYEYISIFITAVKTNQLNEFFDQIITTPNAIPFLLNRLFYSLLLACAVKVLAIDSYVFLFGIGIILVVTLISEWLFKNDVLLTFICIWCGYIIIKRHCPALERFANNVKEKFKTKK